MDTQNDLERSLQLAANEPAHRPEFYQILLRSSIYVLGSAGKSGNSRTLAAGSKIGITHWQKNDGTQVIPFFSSLATLKKSIDTEQPFLELTAKALFEMTPGKTLCLNPKSPQGKEFTPEEIRHLLADGLGQKPVQRTVGKETKVLLGQPTQYPTQMVDSLSKLLSKHSNVTRAYVALMHDTSIDKVPHLVVGIEGDGDIDLVLRQAVSVAGDTAPDAGEVDLCRVSASDPGLSQYFLTQAKPFYERKKATTLSSYLDLGKS